MSFKVGDRVSTAPARSTYWWANRTGVIEAASKTYFDWVLALDPIDGETRPKVDVMNDEIKLIKEVTVDTGASITVVLGGRGLLASWKNRAILIGLYLQ